MRTDRRSATRLWLGPLGYGLLCLVLLFAAVDLHLPQLADASHEPLALGGHSVFHPGAAHPGQPVHFEKADPVHRPHCAACLHRLETRGAWLQAAASVLPDDLPSCLCLAPAPRAESGARRTSSSRAPPFS